MKYYDRKGKEITLNDYINYIEGYAHGHYQIVRQTEIETKAGTDPIKVSTVWLGINYQFGTGPPLIFETMIFGVPLVLDELSDFVERYSTEEEALAGHAVQVARVQHLCNIVEQAGD